MRNHSKVAGFTLAELAVVMIVIGVLIGGVLKGRELIINGQVTGTVAQIKSIDAAVSSFRDMYAAYPGDIFSATTRVQNCSAVTGCASVGDGNGELNRLPNGYASDDEASQFFIQMAVVDLITGINAGVGAQWGGIYPASKLYGGFHPSWSRGTASDFVANGGNKVSVGYYLTLTNTAGAAPDENSGVMTPNQAERIDSKLDDGKADAGIVRGFGSNCTATNSEGVSAYNETAASRACGLHIHIQG